MNSRIGWQRRVILLADMMVNQGGIAPLVAVPRPY
jgi:hypothetical protein